MNWLRYAFTLGFILLAAGNIQADNLYKVTINKAHDVEQLNHAACTPLLWVEGGYLVLIDLNESNRLIAQGIGLTLLDEDLSSDNLFLLRSDAGRESLPGRVVYSEQSETVLRINLADLSPAERALVVPLGRHPITMTPQTEGGVNPEVTATGVDLLGLIGEVSQDSLLSYLDTLVSYNRLTGTESNWAAADWIKRKFESFGYDSVYFDPFPGVQLPNYGYCDSRNIIAVKVGRWIHI